MGLAQQQKIPVELAAWAPNAIFALSGIILLARLERPGDPDRLGAVRTWITPAGQRLGAKLAAPTQNSRGRRFALLPQLVDTYVLTQFGFYFVLMLVSFVFLTQIFTFFDLLKDIVKNNIAMSTVVEYLFFLTLQLVYLTLQISVMLAVAVPFRG